MPVALLLAAWAPAPRFIGNGIGIHMQGGTAHRGMWVKHGWAWAAGVWQGYCNQAITDKYGRFVGWYVDDTVNAWPGPPRGPTPPVSEGQKWSHEANCVHWDRTVYPHAVILAAVPPEHPSWRFREATYSPLEWYPYCGSKARGKVKPPARKAYILQWNFVWEKCGATRRSAIRRLRRAALSRRPKLILYY